MRKAAPPLGGYAVTGALPVSAEPGRPRAGVQVGGRGGPGQESQDRAAIASSSGARSAPAAARAPVSVAGEACAPIRLTDLAARAQLSPATTSELVSDLQRLGYLERRTDGTDRRAKLILPPRPAGAGRRRRPGRRDRAVLVADRRTEALRRHLPHPAGPTGYAHQQQRRNVSGRSTRHPEPACG